MPALKSWMMSLKVGLSIWRKQVSSNSYFSTQLMNTVTGGQQREKGSQEISDPEKTPHLSSCLFAEGCHAGISQKRAVQLAASPVLLFSETILSEIFIGLPFLLLCVSDQIRLCIALPVPGSSQSMLNICQEQSHSWISETSQDWVFPALISSVGLGFLAGCS